jgi:cytochrome c peroxidase
VWQPTRLPLGRDSTIVCSTCHNPHQQGLFHSESVLSLGAIPAGGGDPVALRGGKQICGECHDK